MRDVAAHVISYDDLGPAQLAKRFLQGGLQVKRINAMSLAELAARPPAELAALMRSHAQPRGLATGFGGKIALTDGMIHQQDIRRALAIPRTIEPERLLVALEFAKFAPLLRGAWRFRGLAAEATDLDWSYGSGPEVRGRGEALLMAMGGRSDALDDLSGPGLPKLRQRLR